MSAPGHRMADILRRDWSGAAERVFGSRSALPCITLWTSAAPALSYRLYAEEWQLSPIQTTGVFAIYPLFVVGTLILLGDISDPLRGANHRVGSSGLGPRHTKGSPRLLRVVRNFGTNVA